MNMQCLCVVTLLLLVISISACAIFHEYKHLENITYLYQYSDPAAVAIADSFLLTYIKDPDVLQRIGYEMDLGYLCGHTVAYTVQNTQGSDIGNGIFIHLTIDGKIEPLQNPFSEELIKRHIENPDSTKLAVSVNEFKALIQQEQFAPGIREWTFGLGLKGCDIGTLNWQVRNTFSENKGPHTGQTLSINAYSRECSYFDWIIVCD